MFATLFRPKRELEPMDKRVNLSSEILQFHPFYQRNTRLNHKAIAFLDKQPASIKADPITQCHMAISLFHEMLETENPLFRQEFLSQAEHILNKVEVWEMAGKMCGVIPHRYHPGSQNLASDPWISCQTQGWGMSIFMRAYQLTQKDSFREAALSLAQPFLIESVNGGLRKKEKTGRIFYQKLPFHGLHQHILNGFLSSLVGLHELHQATSDGLAADLFGQGLETVCTDEVLQTFDIGYSSIYGQLYQSASPACIAYNRVHVWQLAALSILSGYPQLNFWAAKWHQYTTSIPHRTFAKRDCLVYRLNW